MYPALLDRFNPDVFRENHRLLQGGYRAVTSAIRPSRRTIEELVYPMTQKDAGTLISLIKSAQSSPLFGQERLRDPEITSLHELRDWYRQQFSRQPDGARLVPVAPSHSADLALVAALVEAGVNPQEIGLVVVDKHFDGVWNLDDTVKASFVTGLLRMGVGGIAIFGMPEEFVKEYTTGKSNSILGGELDIRDELVKHSSPDEIDGYLARVMQLEVLLSSGANPNDLVEPMRELVQGRSLIEDPVMMDFLGKLTTHTVVYGPNDDRIFMPVGYTSALGQINPEKMNKSLTEILRRFKNNGVKYVLYCQDADGLDVMAEGITATPYSHLATVLAYGINRFGDGSGSVSDDVAEYERLEAETSLLRKNGKHTNLTRAGIEDRIRRNEQDMHSLASRLLQPMNELIALGKQDAAGEDGLMRQPFEIPPGGLTVDQAIQFARFTRQTAEGMGMGFGVPYGQGGKIVRGSISEVEGPDWQGNTKKMVARLSSVLNER